MQIKSILLSIDGSLYSRYAAECAWQIAKLTGATITTEHVVDLNNAWQFIGHEKPGFLKRADYALEFETLSMALSVLGSKLLDAYILESATMDIDSATVLDEGDPYTHICARALVHDLVIIGHKPYSAAAKEDTRRQFLRFSVAESLAHGCPKPLLVVQGPPPDSWSTCTAMLSAEHINRTYLDGVIELSEQLEIQPSVICLCSGTREEHPDDLIDNLRRSDPALCDIPIALEIMDDTATAGLTSVWDDPTGNRPAFWNNWKTTLLVAPTREIGGKRLTLFGTSPAMFVRYSSQPAVLLIPEDNPHLIANPVSKVSASAS
jgi:nucleotide-binding universal stress UspA family protein